jgi:hypothetical protein
VPVRRRIFPAGRWTEATYAGHYEKTLLPSVGGGSMPTVLDLFPEKVKVETKPSRFLPNTPCWTWTGRVSKKGYPGVIYKGKKWRVNRLSLALRGEDMSDPAVLACHTCDNTLCCNPEHLFPGSASQNRLDRIKWAATLTLQEMNEIRLSRLPEKVLAKRYKVTPNQVKAIRPRIRQVYDKPVFR